MSKSTVARQLELRGWLARWRQTAEWAVKPSRAALVNPGLFRAWSERELATQPSVTGGLVFGGNGAGLVFVTDARGRVLVVDEVERSVEDGQVVARDLAAFASRLRPSEETAVAGKRPASRLLSRGERRLFTLLAAERVDRAAVENTLVDIGNALRLLTDPALVEATVHRIREGAPQRAETIVRKLRRYVRTAALK